jgi:hypothetical protein
MLQPQDCLVQHINVLTLELLLHPTMEASQDGYAKPGHYLQDGDMRL